jgi:hypothetical protein
MLLTFRAGVRNQGLVAKPLGIAKDGTRDIYRIVECQLVDDVDRRFVASGQPFCELGAGGEFNFV